MRVSLLKRRNKILASMQSDLTDQELSDFRTELAEMIVESETEGVVIDVTVLDVVDSYMARAINDTARVVRLLGSKIVVCGMQPSVAQTLVEMGRHLVGVEAALNMDHGVDKLERMLGEVSKPAAKKFGKRS